VVAPLSGMELTRDAAEQQRTPLENLVRLAVWPAVLALAAGTAALIVAGDVTDSPGLTAALTLVVGLSWSTIGLVQRLRRPANRLGSLMLLFGFVWFAGRWIYVNPSLLYTIGLFLGAAFFAVLGHVLLAFPGGRLEGRIPRLLVTAGYLDTIVVIGVGNLFYAGPSGDPRNLALAHANAELADAFKNVARGVGIALFAAVLIILARRWRRATPRWRHAFGLAFWAGFAAAASSAISILSRAPYRPIGWVDAVAYLIVAAVPLALTVDLLRGTLGRGAVADLVVQLGDTRAPGHLRDALARALHDPTLSLAYWLPEQRRYVDVEGRPVELPTDDGDTVTTIVEREGSPVAALVHDATLRDEPDLVQAVAAAAGLALENERLQADLRARLAELRASRVRMVEATDAERRRLERNLHDGTQQRLVSISMSLALAESTLTSDPDRARSILEEARSGLATALQELRELSQGIHPAVLTERGLERALQELVYLAPMPIGLDVASDERLPEPVEAAAYYVVAEALANVAKYASAETVSVTVQRRDGLAVVEVVDDGLGGADPAGGSGLRGLSDRVEALGGTLVLDSRPGSGTLVRAEIPCAS
jgi:signal transduction histidine kinase